ncbi:hypothetical protein B0H17DRAFT_1201053 [Mycena rosella]|uniref:Uncharacterized protein n=1 Tax=Mycena rosella TaxID=1033263 RepID=A0AAD7GEN2_MYCRO|nr:hypothetical protein B0H17DRAFT_1201053 [Mycena rosella]
MSSLSPPKFTAIDYTAATPSAPSEPSISPLSDVPSMRSALKRTSAVFDSPIFDTAVFDTVNSLLSDLELPEGCATRAVARASIESAPRSAPSRWRRRRSSSSSSSSSRRSSLASITSTESDTSDASGPRLRAIPRLCVAVVVETYSLMKDVKHGLFPGPTPEKQLTIPPVPMMRNIRDRRDLPPAFTKLSPGEKRTRFVCPARVCQSSLWPDLEETLKRDSDNTSPVCLNVQEEKD